MVVVVVMVMKRRGWVGGCGDHGDVVVMQDLGLDVIAPINTAADLWPHAEVLTLSVPRQSLTGVCLPRGLQGLRVSEGWEWK